MNINEDDTYMNKNLTGPSRQFVGGIYTFLIELDRYSNRGIFGKNEIFLNSKEFLEEYNKFVKDFMYFDLKFTLNEWFEDKVIFK